MINYIINKLLYFKYNMEELYVITKDNYLDSFAYEDLETIHIASLPKNGILILDNYPQLENIYVENSDNYKIILRNLENLTQITTLEITDNLTIILEENLDITSIRTLGNVQIIDYYNYLKTINSYDVTFYNINTFKNYECFKYATSLNYNSEINDEINDKINNKFNDELHICYLNRLETFQLLGILNINIILYNLPNLENINLYYDNYDNYEIVLGDNLNSFDSLNTYNTDIIIDEHNYLSNLLRYKILIQADQFTIDERYSNVTSLEIYVKLINFEIKSLNKLNDLYLFDYSNVRIKTDFPKLVEMEYFSEIDDNNQIDLRGSKFPKLNTFQIDDNNLTSFKCDYYFGSSLKDINLKIPNILEFEMYFDRSNLPELVDFIYNNETFKLPSIFWLIIPEYLKEENENKIMLPMRKSIRNRPDFK